MLSQASMPDLFRYASISKAIFSALLVALACSEHVDAEALSAGAAAKEVELLSSHLPIGNTATKEMGPVSVPSCPAMTLFPGERKPAAA
jgi:hypothetical protein